MAAGSMVDQVSAAVPGPPFQANELANHLAVVGRVSANAVGIGRGPADVDPHVAADGPAQ